MKSDDLRQRPARLLERLFIAGFAILLLRCFQLQVFSGSDYRAASERNSVRQIAVPAVRGKLFDTEGRIIVDNRPSYSLFVIPYEFRRNPLDAARISELLGIPLGAVDARIEESGSGPFIPVRLVRDMDFEMLTRIEENRLDIPGVFYQIEPIRTYPSVLRGSHVLGYLGEVNPADLKKRGQQGIRRGDWVGKTGVERTYDEILRGEKGYRYVEVDVGGREVGDFGQVRDLSPVSGRDVMLTLDADLQTMAESLLEDKGSICILDPRSGGILAMVSKPDYDLESFATGLSTQDWSDLIHDPDFPLMDRSIQAQLPPGSTFKPVIMAAALENQAVDPSDSILCLGVYWLGNRPFQCWKPEGHGYVDLSEALRSSCNVYFYRLGVALGIDRISMTARRLGFGSPTGIELEGEEKGLMPDRRYLEKKYGKRGVGPGLAANMAVGQGDILVTPIQMAHFISAVAMSGSVFNPHVVKAVRDRESGEWIPVVPEVSEIDLRKDTYARIQEAMHRVVNEPGGTGRAAAVPTVEACGKTGTAENPKGEPHAWFAGFAPKQKPSIVIVVLVEHGGAGGAVAASIAGKILRSHFSRT